MKIAVVDDEKGILLSMKLYLEMEGHLPYTFSSPVEALNALKAERMDLIIIDMRMPEMTGEELANMLKKNECTRDIPLILFSAHETLSEVAARVGAHGVLEKPFRFEKLNSLINSIYSNNH